MLYDVLHSFDEQDILGANDDYNNDDDDDDDDDDVDDAPAQGNYLESVCLFWISCGEEEDYQIGSHN